MLSFWTPLSNEVIPLLSIVVPARNEAPRIATVLRNLSLLPVDHIILVSNGSRDQTLPEALTLATPKLHILYFHEPLGIDVPRAIGAKLALALGSQAVAFVDGDMVGTISENIQELFRAVTCQHLDMALTNCYPVPPRHLERCNPTFVWRQRLNQTLGWEKKLQLATPAHGPHAVSRRLLETIPLPELAIPPVTLALARLHKLRVAIATTVPHYQLGSTLKSERHARTMIDTIVGDCLEAIAVYEGAPRSREWQQKRYLGFHPERRFDLLEQFLPANPAK